MTTAKKVKDLYLEDEPRFYTKDQLEAAGYKNVLHDEVPSVTTIQSAKRKGLGFEIWLGNQPSYRTAIRYRNNRRDIGLRTHKVIAQYLRDERYRVPAKSKLFFKNFQSFTQRYPVYPVAVEHIVYERRLGYAGTLDLVADIDGHRILIDWKTTKSKNPKHHKEQGAGYWNAVRNLRIDEVWIVYLKRRKTFKDSQIEKMSVPEIEYNVTKFRHTFEVWKDQNPNRVKVRRTYRHGHLEHISSIMRKVK